ncbi:MAG TPA: aminoacyl-tRNA hydrolase [Lachnospiraceae bacterium]
MYLIVGIGNPGKKYEQTRHNAGFDVIDELIEKYSIAQAGKKFQALYGKGSIENEKVILAKPLTYVNLSGESIREMVDYFKIDVKNELIVIYDDIDLEPGQIRLKRKGSAGGHNGIKSIIDHVKTQEFMRIKVGVGAKPKGWDLADHVLGRFSKEDRIKVEDAMKRSVEAVASILTDGIDTAMNRYNKKEV